MRKSSHLPTTALAVAAALGGGLAAGGYAPPAQAAGFIDDSDVSANLYYFQRNRVRKNDDGDYVTSLNHGTAQANVAFSSGYAADAVGFDFSAFGAHDLVFDESSAPDHEFAFFEDEYAEYFEEGCTAADCPPESGISISQAAAKVKFLDGRVKAKAGLTQLSVPGVIGVNWSYQPGTYRGAQVEGNFDNLYLTYAWADEYKAPWYKRTAPFSAVKAWNVPSAGDDAEVDFIHGIGARYSFDNGFGIQAGYGEAEDLSQSYHLKLSDDYDVLDGLDVSYQFYGTETEGEFSYYEDMAWLQALTSKLRSGPYTFRAEFTAVEAEGAEGNYLPRLTRGYSNSQGGLEIWWDARSDWNEHNEKAVFLGVWRDLDDWVGAPGWNAGVSAAYGWDATKQIQTADGDWVDDPDAPTGEESAINLDLSYKVQEGNLKGTLFKLHYTNYNNHQDELGSWYYPNMFQSEHDVKFHIIMPLNI